MNLSLTFRIYLQGLSVVSVVIDEKCVSVRAVINERMK